MGTYELDDKLVEMFLTNRQGNAVPDELAAALQTQLPIPTPTKLGAVVRTTEGIAVLANPPSASAWVLHEAECLGDYTWAYVGDIGRITEVLSEGVDL